MDINDGEFKTSVSELFEISITQESDWSQDGGYTFEDVTNTIKLDAVQAGRLAGELENYFTKVYQPRSKES